MKKKLFTSFALFFALAITSCAGPARKSGESNAEETPASESSASESTSSKHTHTWSQWDVTQAYPCVEGTKTRTCSGCGKTETETVPAGEHVWGEVVQIDAPSCKEGRGTRTCSQCGKVENVPIAPVSDHSWGPSTITHTAGEGEVTETFETCANCGYTRISWDAHDANKETNVSGFDTTSGKVGKLNSNGDYVQYKVWTPSAMKARLWVHCTYQTSQQATKADRTSNQAAWYNRKSGEEGWKFEVKVNDQVINQNEQKVINNDNEAIDMNMAVYEDFWNATTSEGVLGWIEVDFQNGVNTIKITRTTGYTVLFVDFALIGQVAAA